MAYSIGLIDAQDGPAEAAAPPEDVRLAALADYRILDTEAESQFDEIVFMASHICHAPVALVSLLEQRRQWFKARVGLEVCETRIEQSVCRHGMASTDLLVILDLTADERTCGNPLVKGEPHIRFYAGAPLVDRSGAILGMLCVIDMAPRPQGLTDAQQRMLRTLAAQVVGQMELRKALLSAEENLARQRAETALLRRSSERFRLAEQAAHVGVFETDIASGRTEVSAEFCRIFGIPVRAAHDLAALPGMASVDFAALAPGGKWEPVTDEFEITRASDGAVRWIHRRAEILPDADGRPACFTGIVADATEQRTLNEEIAHRLKNTLALVQAIAGHTLRGIAEPGPVREFSRRIAALGTAHDLLLSRTHDGADLAELAQGVFSPLAVDDRIASNGPRLRMSSRVTLVLSMLLHELATNAMKYGALSVPGGMVTLGWTVTAGEGGVTGDAGAGDAQADQQMLCVTWRETGGPPVIRPEGKGLGTRLIERGIDASGSVAMDFAPDGLTVTITTPLDRIIEG